MKWCFRNIVYLLLSAILTWSAYLYASTSAAIDVFALSLGVELPEEALEIPQNPLSAEFQNQFRTRSSLRPETVEYYLKTRPSEFLAFRGYIQSLHDNNYLSYEESVVLVESAFNGFVAYANSIASDANTEANTQSTVSTSSASIVTAQSPSEQAIQDALANAERAEITATEVPAYEFGEDVQRKQDEAALAEAARVTAELEADERRKRLEAQAAFLMQELAKANNPREKLLDRVNRILNQHTEQVVQEKADELFDNAEISITSTDSGPQFDARV